MTDPLSMDRSPDSPAPPTERTSLLAAPAPAPGSAPATLPDSNPATTPDPASPDSASDRQLFITLCGVYVAAFMAALDATLVATLLAPISISFDNMPLLGWLASAFFVAATVTQPLAGRLSDACGRRACLLVANAVFALGNVACATAGSEAALLAGRAVAGLGGGAIQPLTSVVMTDLVPLRRRGVWQGLANVCFGVGSGLGGPVGGWVAGRLGWRWAFAFQVPVSALAMALIVWRVPAGLPHRPSRPAGGSGGTAVAKLGGRCLPGVDLLGASLLSTGLVLFLLGLLAGGNQLPWTHPLVLTALPLGLVALAAFAYVEACVAAEPILPVRLLRIRTVAAACLANWFHPMARFGLLFHLPLYLQVQGLTPSAAGLRFLPESAAICVTSLSVGLLIQRTGAYYGLLLLMQALFVGALALVATLRLDTPAALPFVYLFFVGMGFSGMVVTTLLAMLAATDRADAAVITSASYACRSTGQVLGIALASATFRNVLRPALRRAVGTGPEAVDLVHRLERDLGLVARLEPDIKRTVQEAYMRALRAAFLVLLGLGVLGATAGAFVKQHKLHSKLSRRPSEEVVGSLGAREQERE